MAEPEEDLQLTTALEDYLETVYVLVRDKKVARVRDIAQERGVRAASVTPAMKRLADLGLVEYVQREYINLTPQGERSARRIYARHQLLTRFFGEVLALPPDEARENACSMEHGLSDLAMDRLARFFEFFHACPEGSSEVIDRFRRCSMVHDDVAPCAKDCRANGRARRLADTVPLSDLDPGRKGVVSQVQGHGAVRQRLLDMGVLPDVVIAVERKAPSGDPVWIRLQGFQLALRRSEASAVRVHPLAA